MIIQKNRIFDNYSFECEFLNNHNIYRFQILFPHSSYFFRGTYFFRGLIFLGAYFLCYAKNRDTLCKYSKHNFLSRIKFDLGPKEENRRDSSLRYYVKSNHRKFEQAMINSNRSCANSRKCK